MGNLYVVATPIGNLDDLSFRAIKILKESDVILVEDTRQTIKLLNHYEIKTKMLSYHKFNEVKRTEEIIEKLKNGKNIALVSDAGTPCISDPGYVLVKKAKEENVNVIAVPGACAAITALCISGLDTSSFSFYGFVPTINKDKKELFNKIKHSDVKTKIIYESPKRILKTLKELTHEIPGCVVCVCNELTKIHENSIYGKIDDVYEKMCLNKDVDKGEYVIVISNDKESCDEKINLSIEALIVNEMKKNNCSLKDAIKIVSSSYEDISKKQVYNASLNLKNMIS